MHRITREGYRIANAPSRWDLEYLREKMTASDDAVFVLKNAHAPIEVHDVCYQSYEDARNALRTKYRDDVLDGVLDHAVQYLDEDSNERVIAIIGFNEYKD